ncbi:n-(5'-phosphoribosyl)anthranilate isomerase, putative [Candida dubliniensis CD36]|uniref:N-(5'-phosphoribosyl)anthranilate isomerase n=1 Tax=Candida dubliniensis (strain CD36 / ATCC MYA-646 / CBS 7987 / NCPF 3949 / NRRL Y-17841) TaxID=573826 RepID=B9W6H2_CANDC|nr:n-(5'-phosphoribosyl)anthranilate isomerase, putative [Candida dubliniensis CD36]CAX44275.1 n-(5'-phosphoribosyl)anthranilate isomerase, putative [Candida dubliniensis CD36]
MKVVKICGIKSVEAAKVAIDNGANLLGCILVPNRARTIDHEVAKQISQMMGHRKPPKFDASTPTEHFELVSQWIVENGPFLVGVFRNQPREEVFRIARELGLDFIQLHGSEDKLEFVNSEFGIIPRYVVPDEMDLLGEQAPSLMQCVSLPLLDSEAGGEGKVLDWTFIERLPTKALLAGGLTPENIPTFQTILGYDVSGGVETNGVKDSSKIIKFIQNGHAA